jgi:hypothetical protein
MTFVVKCLDCGHVAPYHPASANCPRCSSQWREAEYGYRALAASFPMTVGARPFDLGATGVLPYAINPSLSPRGGTPWCMLSTSVRCGNAKSLHQG